MVTIYRCGVEKGGVDAVGKCEWGTRVGRRRWGERKTSGGIDAHSSIA